MPTRRRAGRADARRPRRPGRKRHRVSVVVPTLQPTVKWPANAEPQVDWSDFDAPVGLVAARRRVRRPHAAVLAPAQAGPARPLRREEPARLLVERRVALRPARVDRPRAGLGRDGHRGARAGGGHGRAVSAGGGHLLLNERLRVVAAGDRPGAAEGGERSTWSTWPPRRALAASRGWCSRRRCRSGRRPEAEARAGSGTDTPGPVPPHAGAGGDEGDVRASGRACVPPPGEAFHRLERRPARARRPRASRPTPTG